MAHLILEYSANLTADEINPAALFEALHQALNATGLYPIAGLRSRALRADDFRVATGRPDFAFAHLNFKIGTGRSDAEKAQSFEVLRGVFLQHFDALFQQRPIALSVELNELPESLRHNQNNLREYIQT